MDSEMDGLDIMCGCMLVSIITFSVCIGYYVPLNNEAKLYNENMCEVVAADIERSRCFDYFCYNPLWTLEYEYNGDNITAEIAGPRHEEARDARSALAEHPLQSVSSCWHSTVSDELSTAQWESPYVIVKKYFIAWVFFISLFGCCLSPFIACIVWETIKECLKLSCSACEQCYICCCDGCSYVLSGECMYSVDNREEASKEDPIRREIVHVTMDDAPDLEANQDDRSVREKSPPSRQERYLPRPRGGAPAEVRSLAANPRLAIARAELRRKLAPLARLSPGVARLGSECAKAERELEAQEANQDDRSVRENSRCESDDAPEAKLATPLDEPPVFVRSESKEAEREPEAQEANHRELEAQEANEREPEAQEAKKPSSDSVPPLDKPPAYDSTRNLNAEREPEAQEAKKLSSDSAPPDKPRNLKIHFFSN